MNGAAVDAGHLQFAPLLVMQIDIGFHAAEGGGDIVHNLVDQFVQIEDGGNLLRPLLQFQQMVNLVELYGTGGDRVRNDRSWACSHGIQPPWKKYKKGKELTQHQMRRFRRRILFSERGRQPSGSAAV